MQNNDILFKEVYNNYVNMVYNICLNYLQNKENAEDVTQQVFIKVFQKQKNFKQKASLKTWIYRIAINQSLDFIKAQQTQKRKGILVPLFDAKEKQHINYTPKNFKHPGVLLEDEEALKQLFTKINSLPINQKTAILLKATEGLSIDEIATIMELSNKAINSLLVRARNNLKKKISLSEV